MRLAVDSTTALYVTSATVNTESTQHAALLRALARAGSQTAMADVCGIRQQSVSAWVRNRKPLPAEHVLAIEAATGVSRHDLRPDIYPPHETSQDPGLSAPLPGGTDPLAGLVA